MQPMRLSVAAGGISAVLLGWQAGADVSGLDAGELGGAAFALGVPHPSGFPLDMLLLRAATLLPLGPLAFRQNLGTALLAAAAVGCVVYVCLRLARQCGWSSGPALLAGASACAAPLLCARTWLESALSVEVYATSLACLALAGILADAPRPALRRALGPLAGLAVGAHITAPLLIAPLALLTAVRRINPRGRWLAVLGAACTALLLCYLPLASLRDTAFDWGDPQTLERLVRHVSAARIREAFADALFSGDGLPRVRLVEQLTEQPGWYAPALLGVVGCLRAQRTRALLLGVLLSLDLAYASWINPMGVAQRQVGHTSFAILALFAGCGAACFVERIRAYRPRWAQLGSALTAGACLWLSGNTLWQLPAQDGYASSERYAAGSPLLDLPARAVYVCESDSACASGLFALYAEGTRPDLDVVPAQHLWDPTVLRRLRGLPLAAADASWPPVAARAGLTADRQRSLLEQSALRPVFIERVPYLLGQVASKRLDLSHVPFIGVLADTAGTPARAESDALHKLELARFGPAGPHSPLARELWASAHETLGLVYLHSGREPQAVAELSRAVALTPLRAAARSNLGIALERRGDLPAALHETAQAVELDPLRATPWVNLTRLLLRVHGPAAARAALFDASQYAVHDARLDALSAELQPPADAR
jgi:hypothetical protein